MGDIRYASGKLSAAAYELVKAGDIKDRLYKAYTETGLGVVFESDFPEELRPEVGDVKAKFVTVKPADASDNIRASISSMSDEDAEKVAEKILDLALSATSLAAKE